MTAPALTAPSYDDVRAVTDEVWTTLLGEAAPLIDRLVPVGTPFDSVGVWSAAVTVSGGWEGSVTVELTTYVAGALTTTMLDLPHDAEVSDADVADAVGELVNMLGGNVKSLMPGPSVLSLPSVAAGRAAFSSDAREVARVEATWDGEPVRVTVHNSTGETHR
ncbi:chemotaxis protein CheX [Nocardioides panacisoli]|uniref:Chemotaxis phosphatase CheX-like domain-containing protein n=1 Tax=Nocardioides panacisoli TaxID=627624 RepID=A0ABP7HS91_9ACTN